MLYPQNGDRIVTIDSVTSLHPAYSGLMARDSRTTVHDKGLKKLNPKTFDGMPDRECWHVRTNATYCYVYVRTHRQTNRWKTHCRRPSAHSFLRFILCCMCVCHGLIKVLTYLSDVIFFVTNKSLRAGYHDFLVRRLCGVCCSAVSNVKTVSQSVSQSKQEVSTYFNVNVWQTSMQHGKE